MAVATPIKRKVTRAIYGTSSSHLMWPRAEAFKAAVLGRRQNFVTTL